MINHVGLAKFKPGIRKADFEELERMLDACYNKNTSGW